MQWGYHGDLEAKQLEVLRGIFLSRLLPNYQRPGYIKQLIHHRKAKMEKGLDCENASQEEESQTLDMGRGKSKAVGLGAASEKYDATQEGFGRDGMSGEEDMGDTGAAEVSPFCEDEAELLRVLKPGKVVARPKKLKIGRPPLPQELRQITATTEDS